MQDRREGYWDGGKGEKQRGEDVEENVSVVSKPAGRLTTLTLFGEG
jgi:hypothetical protein